MSHDTCKPIYGAELINDHILGNNKVRFLISFKVQISVQVRLVLFQDLPKYIPSRLLLKSSSSGLT